MFDSHLSAFIDTLRSTMPYHRQHSRRKDSDRFKGGTTTPPHHAAQDTSTVPNEWSRGPRMLDLLDFALSATDFQMQTSFGCWIFVGFRAAVNVCSDARRL